MVRLLFLTSQPVGILSLKLLFKEAVWCGYDNLCCNTIQILLFVHGPIMRQWAPGHRYVKDPPSLRSASWLKLKLRGPFVHVVVSLFVVGLCILLRVYLSLWSLSVSLLWPFVSLCGCCVPLYSYLIDSQQETLTVTSKWGSGPRAHWPPEPQ